MIVFQILLISLMAVLLLATLVALWRGWLSRREVFVLSTFWIASGLAVAFPKIIYKTARAVGIENGTNLVLYGLFVATAIGFFIVYARMRRMGREITLLVREVAIRDAVNRTAEE